MRSSLISTFSSMWFNVADFMLRCLIHLVLSFMHDNRYGSIFIHLHLDIQFMPAFVEYAFFFSFLYFYFFVKNQVFLGVWINIWVFGLGSRVFLSFLMPVPGCFQFCSSVVEFEVRECDASRSSFIIVQLCFGYPGFWLFRMKLSTVLLRSVKEFP